MFSSLPHQRSIHDALPKDVPKFKYAPLQNDSQPHAKRSIRLLEILPGKRCERVVSELKEVRLTEGLEYEAISYCWGDPKNCSSIVCNGQDFAIPSRLEAALRTVRNPDSPRIVWADAICIDQCNETEKEQQVQLMRTIFSSARKTLIFLGDETEKREQKLSKFAMTTLKIGLAVLRRRVDLRDSPLVPIWDFEKQKYRNLAPFTSEFYLELIGMLRVAWFQRAWVVQEVAVSSKATIFWGSSQYDWDDVVRALKFMSQVNFPLAFVVTLENISAIEEERKSYRTGFKRLHAVLLRHQRCIATDSRDKVYSFSGLIEDPKSSLYPVRVSCHDNASRIFRETAIAILDKDKSLDLLSTPPLPTTSRIKVLPSWVPDWSLSPASTLTYSWGHGPLSLAGTELATKNLKSRFSAAGDTKYILTVSRSSSLLKVEGYVFDTVVDAGPIFYGVQVPYIVKSIKDIIKEWARCIVTLLRARKVFIQWQKLANVRSTSPYVTGGSIRDAFWQTVSTGEVDDSPRIKTELNLWEKVSRSPFGLSYGACVFIGHFLTNRPFLMFEIQGRYSLQRRMVRTKGGYLGLGSRASEVGDSIVLCKGSSVPLILRRQEDGTFSLVGDAYVHGIMKGEAFQVDKCHELVII
ncbi:heterokaryon incompatibility protein-domain-containing protein [Halenospora varia]|nr:heterokaryon incompatibility protein-domain-containing protein [Halenospora varia]